MGTKTHHGQKLLIAVSNYGASLILGASGEVAEYEIKECSPYPDDHFSSGHVPSAPGFYVWQGSIWVDDGRSSMGEPSDPDIEWQGEFRPAVADDLALFGVPSAAPASSVQPA